MIPAQDRSVEQLVVVGGWIGPLAAIVLCVLAALIIVGWRVGRDHERDDEIDAWLSGDDDRDD